MNPQANPSPTPSDGTLSSNCSILDEICQEEGIDLAYLSKRHLAVLQKNGQLRHLWGWKFDLNPAASARIADDKFATFEALHSANLPVIDHAIIYPEGDPNPWAAGCNSLKYAEDYLAQHQNHIVVKPNSGSHGRDVQQITSATQLPAALGQIFAHHYSASLCPFYDIWRENRVVILDGEPRLIYAKARLDDWRFNSHITEPVHPARQAELIDLARKAAATLGLRFCSVDIIDCLDPAQNPNPTALDQLANRELRILEVNSGVIMLGYIRQNPEQYELIKNIYRDAILRMFE